jgi:hypothetical protein
VELEGEDQTAYAATNDGDGDLRGDIWHYCLIIWILQHCVS